MIRIDLVDNTSNVKHIDFRVVPELHVGIRVMAVLARQFHWPPVLSGVDKLLLFSPLRALQWTRVRRLTR